MDKEAHNRKRSIFISLTHKKSREDIRAKEREEQRPLTKKEKIKIIRRNAKKAKLVAVFSASAISLALVGGGGYLLGAASTSKAQNQSENEATKDERDEKKLQELNEELRELYSTIMKNENMIAYNIAKQEMDSVLKRVTAIIMQSAEGEDPETTDYEESCTGSCSSCGGCH